MTLALSVYLRANVPNKVVYVSSDFSSDLPMLTLISDSACFAETGQFAKIIVYANRVNYSPDYASLLQHITRINPDQGAEFATQLINNESGPLVDVERVRYHNPRTASPALTSCCRSWMSSCRRT